MDSLLDIKAGAKLLGVGKSTLYRDLPVLRWYGLVIHKTSPNGSPRFSAENLLQTTKKVANQSGSK